MLITIKTLLKLLIKQLTKSKNVNQLILHKIKILKIILQIGKAFLFYALILKMMMYQYKYTIVFLTDNLYMENFLLENVIINQE